MPIWSETVDASSRNEVCSSSSTAVTQIESDIAVSATAIDFGDVGVGENATQTVIITNTGTDALTVAGLPVTGANASAFVVTNQGFRLTPGTSQTAAIEFAPTAPGFNHATLTVESTDPDAPQVVVALEGCGVAA